MNAVLFRDSVVNCVCVCLIRECFKVAEHWRDHLNRDSLVPEKFPQDGGIGQWGTVER